jgi:hypothetical protein
MRRIAPIFPSIVHRYTIDSSLTEALTGPSQSTSVMLTSPESKSEAGGLLVSVVGFLGRYDDGGIESSAECRTCSPPVDLLTVGATPHLRGARGHR